MQLVLELRFLEETVGKPAQVTGQVFEKALAATKKKVDAAHGDWEAVLKDSSRILPSCMRWAAFNTACFKTLALDQP